MSASRKRKSDFISTTIHSALQGVFDEDSEEEKSSYKKGKADTDSDSSSSDEEKSSTKSYGGHENHKLSRCPNNTQVNKFGSGNLKVGKVGDHVTFDIGGSGKVTISGVVGKGLIFNLRGSGSATIDNSETLKNSTFNVSGTSKLHIKGYVSQECAFTVGGNSKLVFDHELSRNVLINQTGQATVKAGGRYKKKKSSTSSSSRSSSSSSWIGSITNMMQNNLSWYGKAGSVITDVKIGNLRLKKVASKDDEVRVTYADGSKVKFPGSKFKIENDQLIVEDFVAIDGNLDESKLAASSSSSSSRIISGLSDDEPVSFRSSVASSSSSSRTASSSRDVPSPEPEESEAKVEREKTDLEVYLEKCKPHMKSYVEACQKEKIEERLKDLKPDEVNLFNECNDQVITLDVMAIPVEFRDQKFDLVPLIKWIRENNTVPHTGEAIGGIDSVIQEIVSRREILNKIKEKFKEVENKRVEVAAAGAAGVASSAARFFSSSSNSNSSSGTANFSHHSFR